MNKLVKYQLIGAIVTAGIVVGGINYFSNKEKNEILRKENICREIREKYKSSFRSNCLELNSPNSKDKLDDIINEGKRELIENDCNTECEQWWCAKVLPQNVYKPKVYSNCE